MWVFPSSQPLFGQFGNVIKNVKTGLDKKGSELQKKVLKFGLNSSYGFFAIKPVQKKVETCTSLGELLSQFEKHEITDIRNIDEDHIQVHYEEQQPNMQSPMNVYANLTIGSHIVNHAKELIDSKVVEILLHKAVERLFNL